MVTDRLIKEGIEIGGPEVYKDRYYNILEPNKYVRLLKNAGFKIVEFKRNTYPTTYKQLAELMTAYSNFLFKEIPPDKDKQVAEAVEKSASILIENLGNLDVEKEWVTIIVRKPSKGLLEQHICQGEIGEVIRSINQGFRPEDYGYYELIKDPNTEIVVETKETGEDSSQRELVLRFKKKRKRRPDGLYNGGYTCAESAYVISDWLAKRGIKADVFYGKVEPWDRHYYVKTADGLRISGTTPGIPILGFSVRGAERKEYFADELFEDLSHKIPIGGGYLWPLFYRKLTEHTGVFGTIGIKREPQNLDREKWGMPAKEPVIEITYVISFFDRSNIIADVITTVTIPTDSLDSTQDELKRNAPKDVLSCLSNMSGIVVNEMWKYNDSDRLDSDKVRMQEILQTEHSKYADVLYYVITKLPKEVINPFSTPSARKREIDETSVVMWNI